MIIFFSISHSPFLHGPGIISMVEYLPRIPPLAWGDCGLVAEPYLRICETFRFDSQHHQRIKNKTERKKQRISFKTNKRQSWEASQTGFYHFCKPRKWCLENRPGEMCHLQELNPERDPRWRPLSLLWHGASGMLTAPAYKRNVSAHRLQVKLLEMVSAFHLRLPSSLLQYPTNVTGPVLRAFPERMGCRRARGCSCEVLVPRTGQLEFFWEQFNSWGSTEAMTHRAL